MTEAAKIAWKGISKRFDGDKVLDGLDLSVSAGRSLVIIGGSGQGKSVMLKIALGLIRPDAGEVALDGEDLLRVGGAAQARLFSRIGVLFQGAALFDSLTVWENVAFRLINADGVKRREAREMAIDALTAVRLGPEVADLFPSELSGGMQKRAALSRAVVANPDILFFDEPTTGLDPINAAAIDQLIIGQVRRLGCTAVSITHDLSSARVIGDDIAMLHGGKIVWRGPPGALDTDDNLFLRQFVDAQPDGPMTRPAEERA